MIKNIKTILGASVVSLIFLVLASTPGLTQQTNQTNQGCGCCQNHSGTMNNQNR
ncbi:hypothetical protein [Aphanothece hegewaldii]|uniref:hypothetical protein n=1 Tax=Aphanothece hegewaldii TaxID=1521625 RepID=UPI0015E6C09D|nr:hypothetical protein [Aphanothece hegewaldii]